MRIMKSAALAAALAGCTLPAFAVITDAPAQKTKQPFKVETFARGLVHPWGLAFLPDGRLLVTERPGRLRIVGKDGRLSEPLRGVPAVVAGGQSLTMVRVCGVDAVTEAARPASATTVATARRSVRTERIA